MQLIEVNSPQLVKEFLMVPVRLYKKDPNYIRPLDQDVENVFNPKKNKLLRTGEAVRWLLQDNQGKYIGRIAAFINTKTAKTYEQPTGGMGFFDCTDNQEAANILLDACKEWLQSRGMEAMDGPINLGDRDKWWGLLIDGYYPPTYCMHYNYPYYQRLLENYGFQIYFKQYTYHRMVDTPLSPEFNEKAQRILRDTNYQFRHMDLKQVEKFTEDFRVVYNKAWTKHEGVKGMSEAQAAAIMRTLKPIIDERLMWFAYYNEEPIGFFLSIPELNQIFKYNNGKMDLWGKLKFVFNRWRGVCKTMYGIVFGITPEHQAKGVEAAMIYAAGQVVQNNPSMPYVDLQMNWIGDFNPKMMKVVEQIGGSIYKTHATFRYLFDRTKEFKRMPIIR
ncbi:hypothetical protein [Pontibacter harenae]|uniref:hypothetical protein n=1 Tax=Pontibacter harenae TaxID=2894083 RepID=UPI001E584749|nr:hypothetical protein [Pontibacter harenae]MCC9167078.1 hypothetical protein [Pontibacter harenae]